MWCALKFSQFTHVCEYVYEWCGYLRSPKFVLYDLYMHNMEQMFPHTTHTCVQTGLHEILHQVIIKTQIWVEVGRGTSHASWLMSSAHLGIRGRRIIT